MYYGTESLKSAYISGMEIGKWKRLPVYSISKNDLKSMNPNYYYIVFDDEDGKQYILRRDGDKVYYYGTIDFKGNVNEFSRPYLYSIIAEERPMRDTRPVNKGKTAAAAANDEVIGDVQLGIMVDEMLKSARTMTVNDLLAGFNYGLDKVVVKG